MLLKRKYKFNGGKVGGGWCKDSLWWRGIMLLCERREGEGRSCFGSGLCKEIRDDKDTHF